MANALIGYQNRIDAATLSGGSWLAGLPLAMLQDRQLGKLARSTDAAPASTLLNFDLGKITPIRLVGLINHNVSLDGLYRVRVGNDPTFAEADFDSGWVAVWPPVYPIGTVPWGHDGFWTQQYSADDILRYTWNIVQDVGGDLPVRYGRLEINDPSGGMAISADGTVTHPGYIEAGRGFVGSAWQPVVNIDVGAGLGWQDPSDISAALSGAEFFSLRAQYRTATFTTGQMTEDEGMANGFEIEARSGLTGEVIFVFNPADTVHRIRRTLYGRLSELNPVQYPEGFISGLQRTTKGWAVKEITA